MSSSGLTDLTTSVLVNDQENEYMVLVVVKLPNGHIVQVTAQPKQFKILYYQMMLQEANGYKPSELVTDL